MEFIAVGALLVMILVAARLGYSGRKRSVRLRETETNEALIKRDNETLREELAQLSTRLREAETDEALTKRDNETLREELARRDAERALARQNSVKDTENQLRFVRSAAFTTKTLMGKEEFGVFKQVNDILHAFNKEKSGHRLFAQVNLGEILRTECDNAHGSINSKRVDLLIINRRGDPLVAIEYQGSGHYQGNAVARDAVKREAFRRAGVQYLEIHHGQAETMIEDHVRSTLIEHYSDRTKVASRTAGGRNGATRKFRRNRGTNIK